MPTLGDSVSIFQLAFGVNAVLPTLISGFEKVRDDAADSVLSKIKEIQPEFEVKEEDRFEFVDFIFNSVARLRYARIGTRLIGGLSLVFCALSLIALYWAALRPKEEISATRLFEFVTATLIVGPALYFARNEYLKRFYRSFVYERNTKADAAVFAFCTKTYLTYKRSWDDRERSQTFRSSIAFMTWQLRWMTFQMKLVPLRHLLRKIFKRIKKSDSSAG